MESILDLPLSCCGLMKGYGLLQCSPMRNGTQQIKFVFIVLYQRCGADFILRSINIIIKKNTRIATKRYCDAIKIIAMIVVQYWPIFIQFYRS